MIFSRELLSFKRCQCCLAIEYIDKYTDKDTDKDDFTRQGQGQS
jgi:hypothetical protein